MSKKESKSKTFPSLSKSATAVLTYWRQALICEEQIENVLSAKEQTYLELDIVDSIPNSLGKEVYELLMKKVRAESGDVVSDRLSISICPIRLSRKNRNYFKPFFIPAILSKEGTLFAPEDSFAYFMRECLEPSPATESPIVGSYKDSKKAGGLVGKYKNFNQYVQSCETYFKKVTGYTFRDFILDEWETQRRVLLIPHVSNDSSFKNHVRLLTDVLSKNRHPGAISQFAETKKIVKREVSTSKYNLYRNAKNHVAHMNAQYALSLSQRNALYRFNDMKDGEVYPVTGPPGTGKTTVLQNFIVNSWVQAAIRNDQYPPIQVVCGATNQSVLNVINSFEQHNNHHSNSFMYERWLPDVHSLGLFCSSFSKAKEVESYQIELLNGQGFTLEKEKADYVIEAEKYFLKSHSAFFKETNSVRKAVDSIYKQLQSEVRKLQELVQGIHEIKLSDILLSLLSISSKSSLDTFHAHLQSVDTGIRHDIFVLAMHFWEGRWLIETVQELKKRKPHSQVKLRSRSYDWQRRAMITPVFVSTVSSAAKFFTHPKEKEKALVDILYFDEAGQIPPEKAAPLFSLSKRTVAIGDVEQLEPYTVVPEPVDHILLSDVKLIRTLEDDETFDILTTQGLPVSTGNLMTRAIERCSVKSKNEIGSFLSEHRRSVPQIISYCNELSYHGKLVPMRRDLSHRVLPALSFIETESPSAKVGQSRKNSGEVEQVISFVKKYQEILCTHYNVKHLSDILAIITPFVSQAGLFKERLKSQYPEMIIGTVNSLQGAEKEIVIFSSVYSEEDRHEKVFDAESRLLNVAVSRARDSFILFGSPAVFNPQSLKATPSRLLAQHIAKDVGNL